MLTVHHADRAEALVDVLAGVLATPPDDPFTADVVAVPSRGIERWLAQQLARRLGVGPAGDEPSGPRRDGVAANIRFPFPGGLLRPRAAHRDGVVLGSDDRDDDPWQPGPLAWQVLTCARLGGRDLTFARAAHVAELFDRYAVYRPALLHQWRAERDELADGRPLDAGQRWQAELWRAVDVSLRAAGGVPDPAARLRDAIAALLDDPAAADLPARVSLVALGAMPASSLAVLDAIAVHRDVHVLLTHPSPAWWQRTAELGFPEAVPPHPRRPVAATHPLLVTWGQVAYETELALLTGDGGPRAARLRDATSAAIVADAPDTDLLARLQLDLRLDRHPGDGPAHPWHAGDRSVQIHACHGFTRQVEVLRDSIAHLLDDPAAGLAPGDVVVLCTDLDRAAPIVRSVLGPLPDGQGSTPRFPLTMADGGVDDPIVEALEAVVRTARGRLAATAVVSLASLAPVRRRLGLLDTDIARLDTWVEASAVRWGLDEAHVLAAGLPRDVQSSTWEAALDRMLLGLAMSHEHEGLGLGDRLPVTSVSIDDAAGIGRLAELVHRLRSLRAELAVHRAASAWAVLWRDVVESFVAPDPAQPWEARRIARLLDRLEQDRRVAGVDPVLGVDDALDAVRAASSSSGRGANWGSGGITVCALGDLRGVPFRVVCLLGVDDEALRASRVHPDDLLARQPCIGDRDPRSEQRGLLLDALLAARDHLVITCDGHDVRTNQPLPPATPLAELLDVIDQTVRSEPSATAGLVVHHPRQAFAEACLRPGALGIDGPWSFDRDALDGALARRAGVGAGPSLCEVLLPPAPAAPTVDLAALVGALVDPTGTFLARGIGVQLPRTPEQRSDLVLTGLDALGRWQLTDRLLQLRGRGDLSRDEIDHLWLRRSRADGLLPIGRFAARPIADARSAVDSLQVVFDDAQLPLRGCDAIEVEVDLGDGNQLTGTVRDVHLDGESVLIVRSRAGDIRAKDLLQAKVELLALAATGRPARAILGGISSTVAVVERVPGAVPAPRAVAALAELVRLGHRIERSALPLLPSVAAAWERALDDAARKVKTPAEAFRYDHEYSEAVRLVWGTSFTLADLEARHALDDGTTAKALAAHLWRLLRGDVA